MNRGLAYWADGTRRRILRFALDARAGELDPHFGDGVVDLRANIDRDLSKLPYGPTSALAISDRW